MKLTFKRTVRGMVIITVKGMLIITVTNELILTCPRRTVDSSPPVVFNNAVTAVSFIISSISVFSLYCSIYSINFYILRH